MPAIGTSGSMSGDGKRGVAERPKLPRPSSTLPEPTCRDGRLTAFGKSQLNGGIAPLCRTAHFTSSREDHDVADAAASVQSANDS
jgi:hypothetical protein